MRTIKIQIVHFLRSLTAFQKNVTGITIALISFSGYGAGFKWSLIPAVMMLIYICCHTIYHNLFVEK